MATVGVKGLNSWNRQSIKRNDRP